MRAMRRACGITQSSIQIWITHLIHRLQRRREADGGRNERHAGPEGVAVHGVGRLCERGCVRIGKWVEGWMSEWRKGGMEGGRD